MKIVKKTAKLAVLQVSFNELKIFTNAIKEMCKYLGDFGFHARIGSYPDEVKLFVNYLFQQINKLEQEQNVNIETSLYELMVLNSALHQAYPTLRVDNFQHNIGTSLEEAKTLLNLINSSIKEIQSLTKKPDNQESIKRAIPLKNTQLNKENVSLETEGYRVDFFLRTSNVFTEMLDIIIILDSPLELGKLYLKTPPSKIFYSDILNLTQYLEQHIDVLQHNPVHISSPLVRNASLFKIQAFGLDWTSKNEETFTLQFMLNALNPKARDNIGTYVGLEARITFPKVRDFIRKMRVALAQLPYPD
ncbi:MAG TPA: hypothetical protein DCL61_21575 [Cyanobacteria bacterium UBA12227]|nr:hypothetical protein [Cyanobacteria bacterium UBA12227]HAX86835.1 hypothetical protein [Cyanobacteria bacterium UBA11370]HBY79306.1 hypothetical protein [Cyanobacteria bacterium UBA11148]